MKNVLLIKRMNTSQKRFKDALEANGMTDAEREFALAVMKLDMQEMESEVISESQRLVTNALIWDSNRSDFVAGIKYF